MERKIMLYLLGPITKAPDHIRDFRNASQLLKKVGYEVVNPLDLDPEKYFSAPLGGDITSKHQLRVDLHEMMLCDGIAMLPVFVPSDGCAREMHLAHDLEIPLDTVRGWVDRSRLSRSEMDIKDII